MDIGTVIIDAVVAGLCLLGLLSGFALWPISVRLWPTLASRALTLFRIHAFAVLGTGLILYLAHARSWRDPYIYSVPVYLVGLASAIATIALVLGHWVDSLKKK